MSLGLRMSAPILLSLRNLSIGVTGDEFSFPFILRSELYFSDQEIINIMGGNLRRVFQEVERVSSVLQSRELPYEDTIYPNVSNCRSDF